MNELINGDCLEVLKGVGSESYDSLLTDPTAGGVILDPFMGSGSTGIAAKECGFKFVGIEKELDYFSIAKQRMVDK